MSYTLQTVRDNTTNEECIDLVNDSCQIHNIFLKDKFIKSVEDWFVCYDDNTQYTIVSTQFPEIDNAGYVELLEKYKKILCG